MTYTPTPESELTEEEVRRWFNRLRELYQQSQSRVHQLKVERKEKNLKIIELEKTIWALIKENKHLNYELNKGKKEKKTENPIEIASNLMDFKKKFFDSL